MDISLLIYIKLSCKIISNTLKIVLAQLTHAIIHHKGSTASLDEKKQERV
jgi:hypothetical protein